MSIEACDQLQEMGLTISQTSTKDILKKEMEDYNLIGVTLKEQVEKGKHLDPSQLEIMPHLHLGKSKFPTEIVSNGLLQLYKT